MVSRRNLDKITIDEAIEMFNSNDPHIQEQGRQLMRALAGVTDKVVEQAHEAIVRDTAVSSNGNSKAAAQELEPDKVACPECGKPCREGSGLKIHMSKMHPGVPHPDEHDAHADDGVVTITANDGAEFISLGTPPHIGQNDTDSAVKFVAEYAKAMGVTTAWRDGTYVWLAFAEKPAEDIRRFMKEAGLFFAPRSKRWYYPSARDQSRPRGDIEVIV